MKAVTPVIALVMLLLITVGIVGVSYSWFSGTISASTKKAVSIPPGGVYCTGGDIKAFVLNNGDSPVTANDISVADVDGVSVINTPFFGIRAIISLRIGNLTRVREMLSIIPEKEMTELWKITLKGLQASTRTA